MTAIEVTREGGVQTVRMNRAEKKNALTGAMYQAMADALAGGEVDDAVGAHLILGTPGAFSAGNDIEDFLKFAVTGELGSPVLAFLRALATVRKPLVAGVDGLAIGVGTTMLFHCDMVVASPRSTFKTPFVDLALVPEAGSSLIAPRIMGPHRAFEMLCAGLPFDAARAEMAGFVNRVVSEAEVEPTARALAAGLAKKPREALRLSRQLVRGNPADVLARIDEEAEAFKARLKSDEARAAFMAFMARKA